MNTVTLRFDHPEALALAALEFGNHRASMARRMAERIGTDGRGDNARRKLAARAAREAAAQLTAAATLLESGQ